MKKINVITLYPRRDDAVSFYRGLGVMNELPRVDDEFVIKESNTLSWMTLAGADEVFFLHPFITNQIIEGKKVDHWDIFDIAHKNRKPVIVDYDDLLCEIPEDNHFYRRYKNEPLKDNFIQFINEAEGVIFSTDYLLSYCKDNKIIKHDHHCVIKNSVNHYLSEWEDNFSNYNKTILWRGTSSHYADFGPYIEQLLNVVNDNKDFTFIFLGFLPDKRLKEYSNVSAINPIDPVYYFNYIKKLNPSICFVPLLDIPFNLAKSCIAKIEATMAGAITLSPDFPEWKWNNDPMVHFDEKDFEGKMNTAIELVRKKDNSISDHYKFNYKYILDNFMLEDANKKRASFLRGCRWNLK
jgi:hypothetical protein